MATVFTYMPLLRRVISFANDAACELEEEKKNHREEAFMWKAFLKNKKRRFLSKNTELFINERIKFLNEKCADLNSEIERWQSIIRSVNPCEKCGGVGEFRVVVEQDESKRIKCTACKGRGIKLE